MRGGVYAQSRSECLPGRGNNHHNRATTTGKNSACSSLVSGRPCVEGDSGEVTSWGLVWAKEFRVYSKCS